MAELPVCECGCGSETSGPKTRFLPGHDAKLKSRLMKEYVAGDEGALAQAQELGWAHFLTEARAREDGKAAKRAQREQEMEAKKVEREAEKARKAEARAQDKLKRDADKEAEKAAKEAAKAEAEKGIPAPVVGTKVEFKVGRFVKQGTVSAVNEAGEADVIYADANGEERTATNAKITAVIEDTPEAPESKPEDAQVAA